MLWDPDGTVYVLRLLCIDGLHFGYCIWRWWINP